MGHLSVHRFPLALIPGNVALIDNVVKICSKKGHPYFISTIVTSVEVIEDRTLEDQRDQNTSTILVKDIPDIHHSAKFKIKATVEKIVKASITAICTGCGSKVKGGRCGYSGCHYDINGDPDNCDFQYGLTLEVGDRSGSINLISKPDENSFRSLLDFSPEEMHFFKTASMNQNEDFVHLNFKNTDSTMELEVFSEICSLRPSMLRIEILAECRRFKEKTEKQTEAEIFVDSYSNSANFRERILALNLKHLL